MRKQPDKQLLSAISEHLDKGIQPAGTVTWVRKYRLITPLFGGGVSPMECDPVTIIRGSEVRGQLRFWWRATRGGRFGGCPSKMKEAETKIWGAAHISKKATTSPEKKENGPELPTVQIVVEVTNPGESKRPFKVERNSKGKLVLKPDGVPEYAAFPLRPPNEDLKKPIQQIEAEMKRVQHNVEFTLTITFAKDHEQEIRAALWAWETFGGLGARTRRGFGAIQLLEANHPESADFPPKEPSQIAGWIRKRLEHFVAEQNFAANIPHLSPEAPLPVVTSTSDIQAVWRNLIKALSEFRQAPDGRDKRSYWPEAEAIRTLTRRRDEKYKSLSHPHKFPRAAFGLPIVFHFKDKYDPKDTSLQGVDFDRFASPLILRPLAYSDKQAVGIAIILKGVEPAKQKLILKELEDKSKEPYDDVHTQLNEAEARQLKIPQLKNGQTNVLKAFMDYLKGK